MSERTYLEGLQDAAGVMCGHCFRGVPVRKDIDGVYRHYQQERHGAVGCYGCNAQSIIPLIEAETDGKN